MKKLQQELGQLNYYEGPVDGITGTQTTAAIKDLQRQAGAWAVELQELLQAAVIRRAEKDGPLRHRSAGRVSQLATQIFSLLLSNALAVPS